MVRRLLRTLPLVFLIAVLVRPSLAQDEGEGTTIEIVVSRQGYDGRSDSTYAVRAGQPVSLTFVYGDTDLALDNPHTIAIVGLDVPQVTIRRDQPRGTIEFMPEEPGQYRLVCTIACAGMENLVGGTLRVNPLAAPGLAADLRLELVPEESGYTALARATLLDPSGWPLTDAPLVFTRHMAVGGELPLDTVYTSVEGVAALEVPAAPGATISLGVHTEDGSLHTDAEATVPGTMAGLHPASPLAARTPPPVLAVVLIAVVGGVWVTYGFVVYQLVKIRLGAR